MKTEVHSLTPDRLVSKTFAAEILGVSVRTIERLISSRQLTKNKVLGCVRLRLGDVLRVAGIQNSKEA